MDFYFKTPEDSTYNSTKLEEDSELQNLISQIKMLIFTNNGDVLGVPKLGLNIEKLIFETNYNKYNILSSLKNQTRDYLKYDRNKFNVEYDLEFYKGTNRDIGVFNVIINGQKALDILLR